MPLYPFGVGFHLFWTNTLMPIACESIMSADLGSFGFHVDGLMSLLPYAIGVSVSAGSILGGILIWNTGHRVLNVVRHILLMFVLPLAVIGIVYLIAFLPTILFSVTMWLLFLAFMAVAIPTVIVLGFSSS